MCFMLVQGDYYHSSMSWSGIEPGTSQAWIRHSKVPIELSTRMLN